MPSPFLIAGLGIFIGAVVWFEIIAPELELRRKEREWEEQHMAHAQRPGDKEMRHRGSDPEKASSSARELAPNRQLRRRRPEEDNRLVDLTDVSMPRAPANVPHVVERSDPPRPLAGPHLTIEDRPASPAARPLSALSFAPSEAPTDTLSDLEYIDGMRSATLVSSASANSSEAELIEASDSGSWSELGPDSSDDDDDDEDDNGDDDPRGDNGIRDGNTWSTVTRQHVAPHTIVA